MKTRAPDPVMHQAISFLKSGARLLGYAFLPINLTFAVAVLIASEMIGIVEELV